MKISTRLISTLRARSMGVQMPKYLCGCGCECFLSFFFFLFSIFGVCCNETHSTLTLCGGKGCISQFGRQVCFGCSLATNLNVLDLYNWVINSRNPTGKNDCTVFWQFYFQCRPSTIANLSVEHRASGKRWTFN